MEMVKWGSVTETRDRGIDYCRSGPSFKNEDYKINHRHAEHQKDMQVMCGEGEENVSNIVASV